MAKRYPHRPKNTRKTLPFHCLFQDLFNPLLENRKKPTAGQARGRKAGPHGGNSLNPHEVRRAIIERFFSKWRREVGDDFFPAFQLILPEKDRERAMYGLKEKALAKFLVKIMRIDKNSDDAYSLTNWKVPGQNASKSAGDFAMRVFETISKRAFRVEVGDMTIEEVNDLLNDLAAETREENQLPIIEQFYKRMNPEEMMWLIRIILRSMKIGATEKTILNVWHPDAETLFNVCSNLRRVCYELFNPNIRLENEERSVSLMQCFQPQLAYFNDKRQSYPAMVASMKMTEDDQEFWIEEKLDGERMQLHMISDPEADGGRRFNFWSRKAKDYTYLYGKTFDDKNAALTRHIRDAFPDKVENLILDGEMITWDPEFDRMVPFGTLKTAALSEARNEYARGNRPLFRVFDILYLNNTDLTRYTLRDRRSALEASLKPVHRRIEILEYSIGEVPDDIESKLQTVIEEASEGLVLKNPRSPYRVNDRHDDWLKVKPEYMQEFGESLDCLIIGGYYGSGHRGGGLSSFLCGLRSNRRLKAGQTSQSQQQNAGQGDKTRPFRYLSFFKVGGGMTREDYAALRHRTDGKWINWNSKNPPTEYIELAGGPRQIERPDQWIKPEDSLVVEVKAASVTSSDEFATGLTLRFPRFKRFRDDKAWDEALTFDGFMDLKALAEDAHKANIEKQKLADAANAARKRKGPGRTKKPLTVAGYNARDVNNVKSILPQSKIFRGLNLFIMTECSSPVKRSKLELEELVKANGGRIVQGVEIKDEADRSRNLDVICVAERRTVKVASLVKRGEQEVVRPVWIFDCIHQANKDFARGLEEIVLPLEPERHLFFVPEKRKEIYEANIDQWGDSYARDLSVEDLRAVIAKMDKVDQDFDEEFRASMLLDDDGDDTRGGMFSTLALFFDPIKENSSLAAPVGHEHSTTSDVEAQPKSIIDLKIEAAKRIALFSGASILEKSDDQTVTHIIVHPLSDLKTIRKTLSRRKGKIPRVVTFEWVEESWNEGTRLDEERFAPLS